MNLGFIGIGRMDEGTVVPSGAPDAVAKAGPLYELIGKRARVAGLEK